MTQTIKGRARFISNSVNFSNKYKLYFHIPADLLSIVQSHSLETFPELYLIFKRKQVSPIASWIVRTAYELAHEDVSFEFTDITPEKGILIGTNQTTSYLFRPGPRLLFVHIGTDGSSPHPYAQINISQNKRQFDTSHRVRYMPHWPHAGLIPRSRNLSNRVTNIAYFGDPANLANELRLETWRKKLSDLGFNWMIKTPSEWHNYSDVDVIVAVRDFNSSEQFTNKPASKLYNAWIAGVPALLGRESAYVAEKTSQLDYIEVNSQSSIIDNLILLRKEPNLFQRMITRSRERAAQISSSAFRIRWKTLLDEEIYRLYDQWILMPKLIRYTYLTRRYLELRKNGLRKRIYHL